jgi:hypothetical protein
MNKRYCFFSLSNSGLPISRVMCTRNPEHNHIEAFIQIIDNEADGVITKYCTYACKECYEVLINAES